MKHKWTLLTLICILFLFGGHAQASSMYAEMATEAAPEVSVDSVEIGTPFSLDVYMENDFGVMLGGSMPLAVYGTDGLTNITHNDVGGVFQSGATNGQPIVDGSITTHNGWDAKWSLLNQWASFSWDGLGADTANWTGATFSPWMNEPATHYVSFHFDIADPGMICIDSVSIPNQSPPGKYDWLFDDPNFTFGGPYCFKIYDPNAVSNTAPEFAALADPSVDENVNLNFGVSATDPEGDALTLTHSTLPTGAGFTDNGDGTGTFDWTPTFDQAGDYPVTFTVSDGELTDVLDLTITVNNVNRAPVLAAIGDKSGDENALLTFAVSATDPDGTTPTITAATLPTGASFDGTTFSWTPTFEQAGDYPLTFTATDGEVALDDTEAITITINNINRDPVLDAIGDKSVDENVELTFTVTASDIDGDIPGLHYTGLPTGAGFVDNGDGTGTFTWTPTFDQAGDYEVTFIARDSESAEDTEAITITVNNINRDPVLDPIGNKSVDEGAALSFAVTASDPDGYTPDLSATGLPTGATFTGGTFNWTPTFDQAGTHEVIFYATDDFMAVDSEIVEITVNDVTSSVQLVADNYFFSDTLAENVDDVFVGQIVVSELSDQNVEFWISNDESWLNADTIPYTPVMTPDTIDLYLSSTGLTPDPVMPYTDSIKIFWDNGGQSDSIMITVQMFVEPDYNVIAEADHLDFVVFKGETVFDSIYVYEEFDRDVEFEFYFNSSWLGVDAVGNPPYHTPEFLFVIVEDTTLEPGFYTDSIFISQPLPKAAGFETVVVPVTLTVEERIPVVVATPNYFEFNMDPDSIVSSVIEVTEQSGGNYAFAYTVLNGSSWLLADTVPPFVTPDSIFFAINTDGLAPGYYSDSIRIYDPTDGPINFDEINVPIVLIVEDTISEPYSFTFWPSNLNYVLEVGQYGFDSVHVEEDFGRNVPMEIYEYSSWIEIHGADSMTWPPFETPDDFFVGVSTDGLAPGFYVDTLYIAFFPGYDTVHQSMQVSLTVEEGSGGETADSVWISTVPAVPGNDVIVPIYMRNFESLSAINLPLTWTSDAVTLTDVTFDGTIVESVDNKPVSIDNASRRVQIGIAPTFTPNIDPNRGMLAKLHFSVSDFVTEALVTIDTTSIFPEGGLKFIDEYLNIIDPTFINGSIVIDTSSGLVCGRVIDELGNEIDGASVELWDNFPSGGLMTSETTSGGGQFACAYAGVFPFDAYAYKEGYYPGLVEDIQFGELGIEIVLTSIEPIAPTPEWVDFYCDYNYYHNVPLPVGSVVDAYDPDGIHCGSWFVSTAGSYGFMPVYRDDIFTTEDEGAEPGDEITFYINGYPANASGDRVWTENGDNFEVCLSIYDSEEKCIDLHQGWNLISWNVDLPSDGINDIFDPIMDYVDVILGFDQGGMTYDPTLTEFSTLWNTDHFHGYWVKMNDSAKLCVTGTPISANTPIGLSAGWNLVSYLPNDSYATPTALASIHDDNLMVALGFDQVALTYDPTLPEYSTLNEMSCGFGYWLYSYAATDLVYPGAGPGVKFRQDSPSSEIFAAKGAPSEMATSRNWMNVYAHELTVDGEIVAEGSEVKALDANGRVVGYGTVAANGRFGFMSVYADDPSTEKVEGLKFGEQFSLVVDDVETGETFEIAENGSRVEIGALTARVTGNGLLPDDFGLAQNYPNPFNPTTTISFSVPSTMSATVEVYNILGKKVATVFDGIADAGTNTVVWNGADNNGIQVASGVYFYRMSADNYEMTRKMVMMK